MNGSLEYASSWDTRTRYLNPSSAFSKGKWITRQNTNKESRENSEKASCFSQGKEIIFSLRPPEACVLHLIVQVGHKTSCVAKHSLLISITDPSCRPFGRRIRSGWNHKDFFAKSELRDFHGRYQKVEMKSEICTLWCYCYRTSLRCCTSHTLERQKHHV